MDASPDSESPTAPRRRLRILFFVHNLGKTRHFDGVIRRLADRGHTVILAAAAKRGGLKTGKTFHGVRRVDIVGCPVHRVDRWRSLAPQLRLARDYLRFFEPAYQHADKLSARAASYAPESWRATIERHPWIARHAGTVSRLLRLGEAAIPVDTYFELFIRYHQPDVVLVTPLVDFGSYQTDYVKAAHRLGIPVAFLPFSWDNLTNRGLIRVEPDRVLVWNEIQKREAVELHRVHPDRVIVTGAARFDDFFELQPSTTREEFCGALGLDPARPVLLYGCSSPFVAPREVQFVREWIERLRRSANPLVASAGVLVRPHPVHTEQWAGVSLGDPHTAIWRGPATMNTDQTLYDSLHHAAALVGLNTSAMLEAAIVGRPVLSMLAPDFAGGQDHTLHFQYLKQENGGLVEVAGDFSEHESQLARVLEGDPKAPRRARAFVDSFLRPRGRHRRVDRIVASEIEAVATLRKRPRRLPALWHYPARWTLLLAGRGTS